jgi:predicted RNA-binding protein YlxR (DUF448 family)
LEFEETLAERTCIVTREQKPEHDLIRFVLSPEGIVTPDLKRKLPGRGCWVSRSRATLSDAIARKAFARAFGEKAEADAGLPDLVAKLLRHEAVSALSLCRKAGLATSGFAKVEDALAKGHVRVLLHAVEAATDGTAKLDRKAAPGVAILGAFSTAEMELAFGRENVIHAALRQGGQTEKLLDLANGLAQYENLKS